jgi:hypothetical protein
MPNTWSAYTSWTEVCQRANGRRKYHSIRRLHARLRRRQVARHLRREGLGYGVRAQLARILGVSKATITSDVRAILAMPVGDGCRQRHQGVRQASGTAREKQPPRAKEDTMSQRCTVRLPDTLYEYLQIEAEARQCGVSDLIREALERLLGLESDHSAQLPKAPEPVALSTPPTHDCVETVLAQLPMDVREGIEERARLLDLPVSKVVTAMLIVQQPPSQPSPQVSSTARPQTQFLRWQEINRQRQQGAASPPAAPAPGTSIPATGARA